MRKLLKYLMFLVLGAFLGAAIFLWLASGEIYDYQDSFIEARDGSKIDVVLCLAGGKGRIPAAVALWKKLRDANPKAPPVLFLSGVGPHANEVTLIEQGVPKELVKTIQRDEIVFENVSTNTFENTQIFSSFVHQKKWKNVLLITASYHMRRSNDILRKALSADVNVYTSTVDVEYFDRHQWHKDPYAFRVTVMEYIKWLFYRYSY